MKSLTSEEIKASEKRSLMLLRDFCEENRLTYYLTFGTLLGAVRHGGFIPWDDDVDVFLPRRDYDYLLLHFDGWEKARAENREVISKEKNPDFYCNYAKIIDGNTRVREYNQTFEIGVWIDVFPMDEIPRSFLFAARLNFCARSLPYVDAPVWEGRAWYKNLLLRLFHVLVPSGKLLRLYYQRLLTRIQNTTDGISYALLYRDFEKIGIPILPKSMFSPPAELTFEGEPFSVPKKYDEFLRACYGDYMVLPPEEQRISGHGFFCVWKEDD